MVERGCSVCGGAGNTCNCLVTGGYGVDVEGNGSIEAPYVVSLAADYLEKKIWCNSVGIPNGYSYVYLDGTQEFFTAAGISLGYIHPELFSECKCECSSGGGGSGGAVALNNQFLYYNAFSEVTFIDDGTTSIAGGVSGPDVQFVQNQVIAAPASMSSPFTGAATESQIRRTATGDIFTLPAFTRTPAQGANVNTVVNGNEGPGVGNRAETGMLTFTNNSATETMIVLLLLQAGFIADYDMSNGILTGVRLDLEINIDGAGYSFLKSDRNETIAAAIPGNILFRAHLNVFQVWPITIAPSSSRTVQTRIKALFSGVSSYVYTYENYIYGFGIVGRTS